MYLPGSPSQLARHYTYNASGTITTGGTPQVVIPEHRSRASFLFVNISDTAMYLEIGAGFATSTISNGVVTAINVTNAGFGFSQAPTVTLYGGGNPNDPSAVTPGQPGYSSPSRRATAQAVMTGSAPNMSIASINVTNGGSGYVAAPYVFIHNNLRDPVGAAIPSATNGILIAANGGSYAVNGSTCTTDPISVFCVTTGKAYTCKFML